MAFVAGRRQYDIEDTSQDVTVASSPWARLMYYLDCVNSCIKDDENIIPYALRNHERYYALSNDEKAAIVKICTELLRIDFLVGKVFFLAKDLDGSGNKFYKLTQTTDLLALGIHADSVIGIGGSTKEVTTIMLMTEHWMNRNFLQALREAGNSLSYGANSSYGSVGMISYAAPPATVYKVPSRRCGAKNKTLKKNKKWLFALFLGIVILGYIAATFTPSYLAQHNAYVLPDVSEWKNNITTLVFSINGTEPIYARTYVDSKAANATGLINIIDVGINSTNVLIEYARGSYPLLFRSWTEITSDGQNDLLSDESYVYFRFTPQYGLVFNTYKATFLATYQKFGSTYWASPALIQQIWFYGWFGLGCVLTLLSLVVLLFSCCKR